MIALMATMMMSLTTQAKTQDVGGRVIDQNGEPLGFVSVALLSADSTYIQGTTRDSHGDWCLGYVPYTNPRDYCSISIIVSRSLTSF